MSLNKSAGRKKVILSSLLLFGPASLLIFISTLKCEHKYKKLDDYGKLPAISLMDENGKKYTNLSFKNQVVIFTSIQNTCPFTCNMNMWALNKLIYEQIYTNPVKLDKVKIVTIVTDSTGNSTENIAEIKEILKREVKGYNPKLWLVLKGDPKQLYALKIKNQSLAEKAKEVVGENYSTKFMLLIDRSGHLRMFDFAQKESAIRSIRDYMNLLQKEYDKVKWRKEKKLV